MKILRSIHSVNPAVGGPIEGVRQSSAVLARLGHVVELISLDAPGDPWVRDCSVPVHAMGNGRGGYGYSPRFTEWIRERHADYDAVIVHGIWQYSSLGVWRALRGTSTPYFVFPHGMLDPWFNRTYPLKHLKKLLYWPLEYRVLRDAAAVLFTSESERRLARESFYFYRCNEVVVNYGTAAPTVDLSAAREEFFDRFPELRGKRLLLFLGRLHEKKACGLLLQAFALSGGATLHLVMAGPCADDDYLAELKRLAAADRNASHVTFTGMLTGTAKWGAFAGAEAFVLPSHQENFGIAVAEALAVGLPVLISNQVNIWREIESDRAGYVEPDDLGGITRLIERWLTTEETERAAMRVNAKRCFENRFEVNRAAESLIKIIEANAAR